MKEEDLAELVRQVAFLQRTSTPEIRFDLDLPLEPLRVLCDSRQISQALVNILKNAAEAIHARPEGSPRGHVRVVLSETGKRVTLAVEDNGCGLPQQERERLTEPYVTTRESGTGLGLAIVKKIMEDHQGEIALEDREGGGARIRLVFNRIEPRSAEKPPSRGMEMETAGHGA
jgi:two-component system nitrogen regulation sensor histidine kinase NtrY